MTRWIPCLSTIVFVLVACSAPPPVEVGEIAPEFDLPTLDGGTLSFDDLEARPTVVAFWATWCQPCYKEIPVLNELAGEPGVQVVSIALDEDGASAVTPFVEEREIRYPVLLGDEETFFRFDGFGIPHTLVLDAEGRIVAVHRGPVEREVLRRELGLGV
jgi:thiol-disulfide isomerase/thioredoxin